VRQSRKRDRAVVLTVPRWADEATIRQITSEAYAVRLLDALRSGTPPVIRHHDGTNLL
jgi:8-oxo-dGTP diphosphatase